MQGTRILAYFVAGLMMMKKDLRTRVNAMAGQNKLECLALFEIC
jgi:hypothetical protein